MSITRGFAAWGAVTLIAVSLMGAPTAHAESQTPLSVNCTGVYTEALVVEGMTCDQGWDLVNGPQVRKAIAKSRSKFTFQRLVCTAGVIDVGGGYWVACHDRKDPARRWFSLASA